MSIEILEKYADTQWGKQALSLVRAAQMLNKSLSTLGAGKGLSLGENLGMTQAQQNQFKRVAEERLRTGHTQQAESMLTISALLGNMTDGNFMRWGQSLQQGGKYVEAIKAYYMAMTTEPDNPLIPFAICQCLIAENEREAAIPFLEMAKAKLTDTPDHQRVRSAVEELTETLQQRGS